MTTRTDTPPRFTVLPGDRLTATNQPFTVHTWVIYDHEREEVIDAVTTKREAERRARNYNSPVLDRP